MNTAFCFTIRSLRWHRETIQERTQYRPEGKRDCRGHTGVEKGGDGEGGHLRETPSQGHLLPLPFNFPCAQRGGEGETEGERRGCRSPGLRPHPVADLVGVGRSIGRSHREHLNSQGFPEAPPLPTAPRVPSLGRGLRAALQPPTPVPSPAGTQRGGSQTSLSSRNCGFKGAGHTQTPLTLGCSALQQRLTLEGMDFKGERGRGAFVPRNRNSF